MLGSDNEENYLTANLFGQFETCSASITARATDLIGLYESDTGQKGE